MIENDQIETTETEEKVDEVTETSATETETSTESQKAEDAKPDKTEEELGYLRHADYTRKTQELAERARKLEEAEAEIARKKAEVEGAKPEDGKSPSVVDSAIFSKVELHPLDGYNKEDDPEAFAYVERSNKAIEAVNQVGEGVTVLSDFVTELLRDNVQNAIEAEFDRCKAAMSEKFDGYELTYEQFVDAMKESKDIDHTDPFAYRQFRGWDNEKRRGIILKQVGPELIKRLEDKAKAKPEEPAPKPPATVDSVSVNTQSTPGVKYDPRSTTSLREFFAGQK